MHGIFLVEGLTNFYIVQIKQFTFSSHVKRRLVQKVTGLRPTEDDCVCITKGCHHFLFCIYISSGIYFLLHGDVKVRINLRYSISPSRPSTAWSLYSHRRNMIYGEKEWVRPYKSRLFGGWPLPRYPSRSSMSVYRCSSTDFSGVRIWPIYCKLLIPHFKDNAEEKNLWLRLPKTWAPHSRWR